MRLKFLFAVALSIPIGVFLFAQQTPTFSSVIQEVMLHATVLDKHKNSVTSLNKENFKIFEDNVEQKIKEYRHEDVPVSLGIVVDNSGSMREKRQRVGAAAMTFVKTSNPQDE